MRCFVVAAAVLLYVSTVEGRTVRIRCRDSEPLVAGQAGVCPFDVEGDGVCSFAFCPSLVQRVGCPECRIAVQICTSPDEGDRFAVPVRTKMTLHPAPHTNVVLRCRR